MAVAQSADLSARPWVRCRLKAKGHPLVVAVTRMRQPSKCLDKNTEPLTKRKTFRLWPFSMIDVLFLLWWNEYFLLFLYLFVQFSLSVFW